MILCIAFLWACCAGAPRCLAEEAIAKAPSDLAELSLEELMNVKVATVYGASRFQQNVSEAPSSVSIVTADEIRKYGYRTLADIIRSERGFFITQDRQYSYVAARGVDRSGGFSNRILVLVDGHRTNENVYGTAFVGNDFILDIDLIERVEIIRGPGSSLYGDNAFFAVINIITRHDKSLQGVEISGEGGSLDSYKGRLSYGKRFKNDAALSLSGTFLDSKGYRNLFYPEFNDPADNNGVAHDLDWERHYSLFTTASLHDFTLQGAYVSRSKGIPTASYGAVFNDARFHSVDNRGYLDLKYEHAFENWEGMARVYFDHYDYHEDIPYAGDTPGTVVINRDACENDWLGTELKGARTLWDAHRLILGVDYQKNLVQQFDNHDIDPYQVHLDLDRPTWRWASYLQDEYTILPNLLVNAGVRYDYYSTFGSTINPRAAVIFSPLENTTLKAIYGEAFRAPNSYELYYTEPSSKQKDNPSLNPEKIRSFELIWEEMLGEHVRTTLGGFYNRISKMINQGTDPDGWLVYSNVSEVRTLGVDAEAEGKWKSGVQGRVSYTYQNARDDLTGHHLADSPRHMAKLNLIVPCYRDRLFSGVELQYLSSRQTLAGNTAKGYLLTNLTLFSRKLLEGVELSGSIYNLFDVAYADPGSGEHTQDVIPQNGRLFRVKLTYQF